MTESWDKIFLVKWSPVSLAQDVNPLSAEINHVCHILTSKVNYRTEMVIYIWRKESGGSHFVSE